MPSLFATLIFRGIAGIAGLIALLAAALHRHSSAIEQRARNRLSALSGYGIRALEHDCWDREDRTGCGDDSEEATKTGRPA